jgi:hypothetical protein
VGVEELDQRLEPSGVRLGVVVEEQDELTRGRLHAEVRAVGEAERDGRVEDSRGDRIRGRGAVGAGTGARTSSSAR